MVKMRKYQELRENSEGNNRQSHRNDCKQRFFNLNSKTPLKLGVFGMFLLIFLLLSINLVSATDWTRRTVYDSDDIRKVTFENWWGLGGTQGTMRLESHTIDERGEIITKQVGAGWQVTMYYDLNFNQDLSNALGDVIFIDMKTKEEVYRDWYYVYWGIEEREREVCIKWEEAKNETEIGGRDGEDLKEPEKEPIMECVEYGLEKYIYEGWLEYDSRRIPEGEIRVGLMTYVYLNDYIDGIWRVGSKTLDRHAQWEASLETDLVSWYKLDETSGDTAVDSVNNYNGTTTTDINNLSTEDSVIGRAFDFREKDEWIDLGNGLNELITTGDFTVNLWINPRALPNSDGDVFYMGTQSGYTDLFRINPRADKVRYQFVKGNSVITVTSDSNIPIDNWTMVTVVRSGTTGIMYFNGEHEINATDSRIDTNVNSGTTYSAIGKIPQNSQHAFDGIVDEVGIWERALTTSEIEALYNNGSGLSYQDYGGFNISLDNPANDSYINGSRTVDFDINITQIGENDLSKVELIIDDVVVITNTSGELGAYNFTRILDNGNYTWYVNATDNETNVFTSDVYIFELDVDSELGVSLISPATNTHFPYQEILFSVNVTDFGSVGIKNVSLLINDDVVLTNSSGEEGVYYFAYEINEGINTWRVIAFDDTYDEEFTSGTRNVIVDLTDPTISITNNTPIMSFSENHSISFIATDTNLDKCWWVYGEDEMEILSSNLPEELFDEDLETIGTPNANTNYTIELNGVGGNIVVERKRSYYFEWEKDYFENITISTAECEVNIINVNTTNFDYDPNYARFYCEDTFLGEIYISGGFGIWESVWSWRQIHTEGIVELDGGEVPCTSEVTATFNFEYVEGLDEVYIYAQDQAGNVESEIAYLTVDDIPPTVSHVNLVNLFSSELPINSVWEINAIDTNLEDCWYNTTDHSTTQVNCNEEIITTWTTSGNKNIIYCANDSVGNENCGSRTITVYEIDGDATTDKTIVGEGDKIIFTLTVEDEDIQTNFPQTTAFFHFLGEERGFDTRTVTQNKITFVREMIMPTGSGSVGGEVEEYTWDLRVMNGSNLHLQMNISDDITIYSVEISDDCDGKYVILNWTLKDQETRELVNVTDPNTAKVEIDLIVTSLYNSSQTWQFSKQWDNSQTEEICVPTGLLTETEYQIDWIIGYESSERVREFHFLDKGKLDNSGNFNSLTSKYIELLNLKAGDSTTFLFGYEEDDIAVSGAIIHAYRKYIGEGEFIEVERGKTDDKGETHLHLVEEDVIYYFVVSRDGEIIHTSAQYHAKCISQPCQIALSSIESLIDWNLIDWSGGKYSITSDKTTRTATVTFNLEGEIGLVNATIYKFDGAKEVPIASNGLNASSGSFTVTAPLVYGNETFFIAVHRDNKFVRSGWLDFQEGGRAYFGTFGAILGVLILLVIVLMAVSEGVGLVIFTIIGLIIIWMMRLIDLPYIALISLIVGGGVLIWKLVNRRGTKG